MVSSEVSPWAKSGGLADVVSSLPAALSRLGHPVAVVTPRYMQAAAAPAKRVVPYLRIPMGGRHFDIALWELRGDSGPVTYFVEHAGLFDRPGLYGDQRGDFPDNHIRFAVLS